MSDKICSAQGIFLKNQDGRSYGPLDFDLRPGEGALIVAPDLSLLRKLMRCFLGQVQVDSGCLKWWPEAPLTGEAHTLWARYDFFSKIAYVDRNCQLLREMSLIDNLMLPHRYGRQQSEGLRSCQEILANFGLTQEENIIVADLPEPQRRLALYALALSQNSSLMLMERPVQFLDHDFDRVWDLILLRASRQGLAYVVFDRTRTIYNKENFKVIENFSSQVTASKTRRKKTDDQR